MDDEDQTTPVCTIEINGDLPQDPKEKIGVLMSVLMAITVDSAEGTMLLMTTAVHVARTHSRRSRAKQVDGLADALGLAVKIRDMLFEDDDEAPAKETLQ